MAQTRQFSDDIKQQFPFKSPLLKYILDNINYKHLHKLYQCCKLFPNKFPLIIIHEIQDITHVGQYVFYNNQPVALGNDSKIWLSDKINLKNHNHREWLPKIWISTIKCLTVRHGLSLNEFKMLSYNGTIEKLEIRKVYDENGMPLSVEDIIAHVPNANDIDISNANVNSGTFTKLAAMKQKCQISSFSLSGVNVEIDPNELMKFIEVHASKVEIFFSLEIPVEYITNFRATMKRAIYFHPKLKNPKPLFDTDIFW